MTVSQGKNQGRQQNRGQREEVQAPVTSPRITIAQRDEGQWFIYDDEGMRGPYPSPGKAAREAAGVWPGVWKAAYLAETDDRRTVRETGGGGGGGSGEAGGGGSDTDSASHHPRRKTPPRSIFTIVQAPFTRDQVESLNAFQYASIEDAYTCAGSGGQHENAMLKAFEDGLGECPWPGCRHVQSWAYLYTTDWTWQVLSQYRIPRP